MRDSIFYSLLVKGLINPEAEKVSFAGNARRLNFCFRPILHAEGNGLESS